MANTATAPFTPTPEMTDGLARQIVLWLYSYCPAYGSKLHDHLRFGGAYDVPAWLHELIPNRDHTPPKSAIAAAIYRAMLEDGFEAGQVQLPADRGA